MSDRKTKPLMTASEVSLFCQQVELLLSSGLPLHEGMVSLAANYAGTPFAAPMAQVGAIVEETGSLYLGVKDSPLFPDYLKKMTRVGETTGQEENVMHGLAAYYDREEDIRKAVRNAVTYPVVLIVMMAVVIAVLILQVLPIFRQVLGGLGDMTEGASSTLMSFGMGLGRGVLIVVGVVLVAVIALLAWRHFSPNAADKVIQTVFPPIRHIRRKLNASRFAGIMAMMLQSGFPLSESLDLLDEVFADDTTRASLKELRDKVEQGVSFAEAIEQCGIFDPLYGKMIRLGFDAGRSDQVMDKLCEVYEADMDEEISRLVSLIEPTLVTVLTLIIGAILLSVMLPLAGILTAIA